MYNDKQLGFSDYVTSSILNEVKKYTIGAVVPKSALFTEEELTPIRESTTFIDGVPVNSEKRDTYTTYSPSNIPMSFMNGVPIKDSINDRVTTLLPLSDLLDMYHAGNVIRIVNSEDIINIVHFLDDILGRLENAIDRTHSANTDAAIEYITEFYENVLDTKRSTISRNISNLDDTNIIGFDNTGLLHNTNTLDGAINLDDVIVK